jgi:hypothetical protein
LVDRRINIIAEFFGTPDIVQCAFHAHDVQGRRDQMLTCRIVKIGCNPLMHLFLKR